jgi:predicted Zn finger-like uncharacterized protein
MKIVCDSCGTKYSIADEKVRGKVFKIRCKKCSHIIVVRGGESAPEEAAPTVEGGWHLVIDGEQVGPVSDADVRTKIERGDVKGDTYTWKEGFADWVKLSAVPEFAGLVVGDDVGAPAPGGELFATGAAAPSNGSDRARRPSGARNSLFGGGGSAGSSDVFAAAAPARGGGDLFAAPTAHAEESRWPSSGAAAAGHDGGRVESLTGQRHENSVLFSLSNLQSLAMPNAAAKPAPSTSAPTTEGSGLIDIRAMAASTLGSSTESPGFGGGGGGGGNVGDDLPAFGAFSPAAPVLFPLSGSSGPPKWIYPLIVVMVGLVGGIAFMAWKVLSAKPAMLVETIQAPAPAPAEPAKGAAPSPSAQEPGGAKPSTIADENLPPREGSPEGKEAKGDKAEKSEHHHGKGGKEGKKVASADDKKGSASQAAAAEAVVPKPAKGSLDDLIDGAVTPRKAGAARSHGSDDDPSARKTDVSAGPLSKSAVVAGMNSVRGKVGDCYNQFKVPGMAMVNVVIGKSGKVGSATVSGKFAGTPTGSCVEKAVKSATFPPSDGFTTPYPFQLK